MNRTKMIQAIVEKVSTKYPEVLEGALKRLSDTNLIAYAMELGVNTDKFFQVSL